MAVDSPLSLRVAIALAVVGLAGVAALYRAVEDGLDEAIPLDGYSIEEAASAIACIDRRAIDDHQAPMVGGISSAGIRCRVTDSWIDLFQAGPIGTGGGLDHRYVFGLDDRVPGSRVDCDAAVHIGRGIIVVTSNATTSELVEQVLGLGPQPMRYPPASYDLPCRA